MDLFGLDVLRRNIAQLKLLYQVNESTRKHFSEDGDLTEIAQKIGAYNYLNAQNLMPSQLEWRVHDYSAFITQLYALYESFVYDLIKQWLGYLPKFFPNWIDLSPSVVESYRAGVGNLLQKFGGPRTEHLSQLSLIEGLYFGISGSGAYSFVSEAFFIGLQNLRESELSNLCTKVGLINYSQWFSNGPSDLNSMCSAQGFTVVSKLKNFIECRNECAHGAIEISDILSANELFILSDFVFQLCSSLAQFVLWNLSEIAEKKGMSQRIGRVTEYLQKAKASIVTTDETGLNIGDTVLIKNNFHCYYDTVLSMQYKDTDIVFISTNNGDEIGLRLDRVTRRGTTISKLTLPT
jgi:hypothetical protein